MPERYFLVAVDYDHGSIIVGEMPAQWSPAGSRQSAAACLIPMIGAVSTKELPFASDAESIAQAAADLLLCVMPDNTSECVSCGAEPMEDQTGPAEKWCESCQGETLDEIVSRGGEPDYADLLADPDLSDDARETLRAQAEQVGEIIEDGTVGGSE